MERTWAWPGICQGTATPGLLIQVSSPPHKCEHMGQKEPRWHISKVSSVLHG